MKLDEIKTIVSIGEIVEIKYKYNGEIRKVYAECGWSSLTGSIKDRVAYQILKDAYDNKIIKKSTPIVEVSSGNMGISLSAIANFTGNQVTIIMPSAMSQERKQLLKMYGSTLIEVDDFKSAFKMCEEYEKKGYFCSHQFKNMSNEKAHYEITGEKFISKLHLKSVDCFVAGIGTSGTLIGVGKRLKEVYKGVKVVALEPKNARIISGVKPLKNHKLQGLSDEILPDIYDKNIVDEVIQISDNDAIAMAQKLCKELSLGVGISSGANFIGCVLAKGDSITIFADDNKKYLSTDLSKPISTNLVDSIELMDIKVV